MAETPPGSDRVIKDLRVKVDELERKVLELNARHKRVTDALYGNPEYGEAGFRSEIDRRILEMREEVKSLKTLCEDLRDERRQEQAERRGRDRLITRTISFTGITNVVMLITVVALAITIWQSGVFGG